MANQLAMDKSFAINNLRAAGHPERRIAQTLGVPRGTAGHVNRRAIDDYEPACGMLPQSKQPQETPSLGQSFELPASARLNSPSRPSLDLCSIAKYFISESIIGISPGGVERRDETA
jgi:hypothetical protein